MSSSETPFEPPEINFSSIQCDFRNPENFNITSKMVNETNIFANSYIPATTFQFNNFNESCGKLTWGDGQLHFEGEADASAKQFFNYLKSYVDSYIECELLKYGILRK